MIEPARHGTHDCPAADRFSEMARECLKTMETRLIIDEALPDCRQLLTRDFHCSALWKSVSSGGPEAGIRATVAWISDRIPANE